MGLIQKTKRCSQGTDNVPIEDLMQGIAEDDACRRTVAWICKQDDFQRRSLIRTQLDEMKLKGAPAEMLQFFTALQEKDFADKVSAFLESTLPSTFSNLR